MNQITIDYPTNLDIPAAWYGSDAPSRDPVSTAAGRGERGREEADNAADTRTARD